MFFELQKQRNTVSGFTGLSIMNLNIFTMGCQQRTFNFNSRKPRVYNREKQLITKNANQSPSNWIRLKTAANYQSPISKQLVQKYKQLQLQIVYKPPYKSFEPPFCYKELQVQEANVPSHVSPNNAKMPSSKTAFQCAPPQYSKSQLILSTPRVKLESKEDQNLHIDNHRECLKYLQALTTSPFS